MEQLQPTVTELNTCKAPVSQLQGEVEHWRNLCQEQESSLSEMAAVVSSSKLEADNLRESHSALQEAQWTADSLVPNCSQCRLVFSVSRRRHHCRNCGLIFCHFCSTQTMALPSAAKPVCVCDRCHNLLLHRYTANS
ncbi:FYVE zinc finger [Paragonimus heterotremus]|uniref:FYVE zinc finger n=1 Tax=Paragonimus heterotremus TaxID=100268 RepID=A0A8J4WEU3_9TREM|nr:FYVE zinc finger [Paragonimus heterotremus]